MDSESDTTALSTATYPSTRRKAAGKVRLVQRAISKVPEITVYF